MNFFAQQEQARRKSLILLVYYLIALAVIVAFFNFLALLVTGGWDLHNPSRIAIVTGLTLTVILIATLKRYLALRAGGPAVAELLGAREIDVSTDNAEERKLRNVTEEMSIAAGTPMPALYVLDRERGINAFVAGYDPGDMVVVVTRGALEQLSRDELQSIVAHEFSHIFHGDTRLNLYLMALLAGITVVGAGGMFLMDRAGKAALAQAHVPADARHGFHLYPILLGALLAIVGYIGILLARMIKAAISRQREFLADAAAVQFTRNPEGMAGALHKIESFPRGTWLLSRYAEEVSHFCFVPPLTDVFSLGAWLATHPPTDKRILAIDKHFYRKLRIAERDKVPESRPVADVRGAAVAIPTVDPTFASLGVAAVVMDSVGNPTPAHLKYAKTIQRQLPMPVFDAMHKPDTVREVVYALLLTPAILKDAAKLLAQREGKETALRANELRKLLKDDLVRMRLPLLDLAMPALKKLSAPERDNFLQTTQALIEADGKVSLFEFAVQVLLDKHLHASPQKRRHGPLKRFDKVAGEIGLLLSLTVYTTGSPPEQAAALYARHMNSFTADPPPLLPPAQCSLNKLQNALTRLARLAPPLKQRLLEACVQCVLADNEVKPVEIEVLRIVAESLDCPMPPLPV